MSIFVGETKLGIGEEFLLSWYIEVGLDALGNLGTLGGDECFYWDLIGTRRQPPSTTLVACCKILHGSMGKFTNIVDFGRYQGWIRSKIKWGKVEWDTLRLARHSLAFLKRGR